MGGYGGFKECSICNGFWRFFEASKAFLRAKIEPLLVVFFFWLRFSGDVGTLIFVDF